MSNVKDGQVISPLKRKLVPKIGATMLAGVLLATGFASSAAPVLSSTTIVAHAADEVEMPMEDELPEEEGSTLDDMSGDGDFNFDEDSNSELGSESDVVGTDIVTGTDDVTGAGANASIAGGTTKTSAIEVRLTADSATALGKLKANQDEGSYRVIMKSTAPDSVLEDLDLVTISDDDKNTVTLNRNAFEWGTDSSVKQAMSRFVKDLQASNISEQNQQAIFDEWSEADSAVNKILIPITIDRTSADIYTAMKWLNPFLPIIRVILGVGAVAIIIMLILSTVIDLAFIGMPIMRERLDPESSGDKKPIPFVSTDAVHAVKTTYASLDEGYKNAYFTYLKNRVWTYILLSICVLYLVLGELSGLIAWLLTLGDGIVQG